MTAELRAPILEALLTIWNVLTPKGAVWVVGGAASRILRGFPVITRDIDLLVPRDEVSRIEELMKPYEIRPPRFRTSEDGVFSGYLGTYSVNNVKTEIIADMVVKREGFEFHERVNDVFLRRCDRIFYRGKPFFAFPLEHSLVTYYVLGRMEVVSRIAIFTKSPRMLRPLDWSYVQSIIEESHLPPEVLSTLRKMCGNEATSSKFQLKKP